MLRVIKLGGSLLDWPEWSARFRAWRVRQAPATDVVTFGGGQFAEAVRQYDAIHSLPVQDSHELAIASMSLSADLAARLLPEARRIDSLEQLVREPSSLGIFDARRFLRDDRELPAGWEVTSDSIAARVAAAARADELVLLKSTLARSPRIVDWVDGGMVDEYFPRAAGSILNLRMVSLRDPEFAEIRGER